MSLKMYKVKLSIANDNKGCARQTPSGKAQWGNYQFYINQEVKDPDFWAVYSKGERKTESCLVAPENTVFVTGEPETVYHYSKGFVNQFGKIVVCQNGLKHPNQLPYQPAQPWHIGKITGKDGNVTFTKNYDDLKSTKPEKTKLISVISSNKAFTKGHQERIDFVQKLKAHFGDKLDLFGHGFNSFDDKWDVMAPYKYHIVLENSSYPDYWTEKLADCYLGNTFPIYYGCTNVDKYFNKEAYVNIDIKNFDAAVKTIEEVIENDYYGKREALIDEAKNLVLDKYNLFQVLAEQFDQMNPKAPKKEVTLKHDTAFMDLAKIRIMIISRIVNKLKMKLK
ncbi:Glycosyltransferase family 10 (fucosyltransferase) C-term [Pustulibacterium marinum]|uniref:Glycosyltransferase family 10 (Fucosyltransferase) C-term n=1 Tax=Pustulibacterium marinum TaxID=1224947 RepID=A0A1I7F222_9FLAO|nr:glycosyltransferase family 10 [Pustulibacterium marinum]SFU30252.1 Glycosyltransferase family 10 (fucosyltransferase) C-term [Pustulibacterium marinum]